MELQLRALPIEKEQIELLHFSNLEVLNTESEKRLRRRLLYMAMLLGNNYKTKVKITFKAEEGIREVRTTVWLATDENVLLKGGVNIPVSRIVDVQL